MCCVIHLALAAATSTKLVRDVWPMEEQAYSKHSGLVGSFSCLRFPKTVTLF